jgi:sugar phosphate isomerase/epimerase
MKIALSGRIFETENGMEKSIDEFIKIASEIGYEGVELRNSQIGNLSIDEIKRVKEIIDEYNMNVSFITCLEEGKNYWKEFENVLKKAIELKTGLIRIIIEDIDLIKKSCQFLLNNKIGIKMEQEQD